MTQPSVESVPWWLGSTKAKKVVHQAHCPHALVPYNWAKQFGNVGALANALVVSGSWRWHHCCQKCNGALDDAIKSALSGRDES